MKTTETMTKHPNVAQYGITDVKVNWNLSPETLQKITIDKGMGKETANGTLAINTGKFTGRSPQDRFIVKDDYTADNVWWGKTNKAISPENFDKLEIEVTKYLSGKKFMLEMVMYVQNQNTKQILEPSRNFHGLTCLFTICFYAQALVS